MDVPVIAPPAAPPRRVRPVYVPAIGPRLRVLLFIVFGLFAVLGATGVYLAAVTALNYARSPQSYTTVFSLWVFLAHSAIGVLGTVPFLAFGVYHWATARKRPNRVAVRLGLLVFFSGLLVCLTGFALIQLEGMPQLPTGSYARSVAYWLHVALPVALIWLYVKHRQAGPAIKWRLARGWSVGVGVFTVGMVAMHAQDPQRWFREGPKDGVKYFEPAATRTADGKFISADTLMMDEYCKKCHADIYNDHFHSAHKFSSFNNPAYLFSVRETRKVSKERDGSVKASRWCAGCHDVVPFVSGAFDNPDYDDVNDRTAHAGLTCTVCHAITALHETVGNGGYTIEEPAHYPMAKSNNPLFQWINNQLVKARPDFHKQTFLKPFHKTAEFCAACHKVSIPVELNHYKEFLRGQNHYDSYLLSGVSGHGTRSFYYPPEAKTNCAQCHMPLSPSLDFGSKDFDGSGERKVHNHRFPAANTGLFALLQKDPRYADHAAEFQKTIDLNANYLRGYAPDGSDKKVRVDLFAIKPNASLEAGAVQQIRPDLPKLEPGKSYVVEVVVRTLGLGHPLTQGTVDSNEIWVDFQAMSGGKEIARSGALANPDDSGPLDKWAHTINVLMLDRNGNRINRRNPQDIFTPLYNKQIGPGAAAVVHYRLDVPKDATGPVELNARVRYRKFDYEYMKIVHEGKEPPKLPVVDLCSDKVTLPVAGGTEVAAQTSPIKPAWQRWNDYGIGSYLEGGAGGKQGFFKQAEQAFTKMLTLGDKDAIGNAHLNLARVYLDEGRTDEAAVELEAAGQSDPPAPAWSRAWFTILVNSQNSTRKDDLDKVIADLETLLDPNTQPRARKFDFTLDYVVWNTLANRLYKRRQYETDPAAREAFLLRAIKAANRVLALEAEDVEAHDALARCYAELAGDQPTSLPPVPLSADEASSRSATAADAKQPAEKRIQACGELMTGIPVMPMPRLPAIKEAIGRLGPAFESEADLHVRSALAAALTVLHRESHAIYKPDEVAESRATQIYRAAHPEANYVSRSRVIYPTTPEQREAILKTGDLPAVK
jgi:tetratricopeptide (TPR) repeat protein